MGWAEPREDGTWRARYRVVRNGRQQIKTAGIASTKVKAEKLAADEEAKLRGGTWFDHDLGRITLAEYFEQQWIVNRGGEVNTKDTYWAHYRRAIRPEFGNQQLRHILPSNVQGWVARMQAAGVTAVTIRARVRALQTILAAQRGSSALRDGLIARNPCAGVQLPPVVAPEVAIYSPREIGRLIDAMDPWWQPLPLLAVETGLRWGELMGLETTDFTPSHRALQVTRTVVETAIANTGNGTRFMLKPYPKTLTRRRLGLRPNVSTAVHDLIAERGLGPGDRLFSMPAGNSPAPLRTEVWPNGMPVSRAYFRESVWRLAIAEAGVPERRFHDLRASHISWLLAGKAELPVVMERVGHTQFTTTRRYSTVLGDGDEKALSALNNVTSMYQ